MLIFSGELPVTVGNDISKHTYRVFDTETCEIILMHGDEIRSRQVLGFEVFKDGTLVCNQMAWSNVLIEVNGCNTCFYYDALSRVLYVYLNAFLYRIRNINGLCGASCTGLCKWKFYIYDEDCILRTIRVDNPQCIMVFDDYVKSEYIGGINSFMDFICKEENLNGNRV